MAAQYPGTLLVEEENDADVTKWNIDDTVCCLLRWYQTSVHIFFSIWKQKQDIWHIHTYSIQRSSTSINLRWLQTRVAFLWRSSWVQIWGLALSKSHWFQVLKILLLQIRWFINVYHLPNCETDLLEYPPLDKNWQTRLVQLQSQLSLLKNPHYDEMYNHYFPIYCWFTGHPSIFKYDM